MKLIRILIVCMMFPWAVWAQQQTEYNRKGDDALKRKDYRDAKMWFEEGVSYCDAYSIDRLTEIWLANERMRPSMRSLMNKCLNCLNVRGTEQDTTAMHQLILYYKKGIGTPTNDELAQYWTEKLTEARKQAAYLSYAAEQEVNPKESMSFFVGYHYSIEAPYGLTVGGMGKHLGWYVRFKTNMAFDKHTAECSDRNGGEIIGISSDQSYYFTGNKKKNSFGITAGMVIKCTDRLYTSVGLGYGSRSLLYEYRLVDQQTAKEEDAAWAKHLDASRTGVAADWDAIVKFGKFFISAGCSTINFKYVDLNAGAGVFF